MRKILLIILLTTCLGIQAQVGDYRNRFSVGGSAGYVLDKINFQPTVPQGMHGGMTFGISGRYTCEKYFTTLCAVQLECNIVQGGWKQKIETIDGNAVINPETGIAESYERTLTYIQIPFLAHLSWGYERKGLCFMFNAGPQIGILIGDKTSKNYNKGYTSANYDNYSSQSGRVSKVDAQETMAVENKLDYGITAGVGLEGHINHIGRFSLDARYYYGLGNLYGDSKRDYFGNSNHNTIVIKLGYLFDLNK